MRKGGIGELGGLMGSVNSPVPELEFTAVVETGARCQF
jgi:hypothetical protein